MDVNNDGLIDIVAIEPGKYPKTTKILWFANDGKGGFSNEKVLWSPGNRGGYTVEAIDINDDGYSELILGGNSWDFPTTIAWNNGNGEFKSTTKLPNPSGRNVTLDYIKEGRFLYLVRVPENYIGGIVQQIDLTTFKTTAVIQHKEIGPKRLQKQVIDGETVYAGFDNYSRWTDFKIVNDKPEFAHKGWKDGKVYDINILK